MNASTSFYLNLQIQYFHKFRRMDFLFYLFTVNLGTDLKKEVGENERDMRKFLFSCCNCLRELFLKNFKWQDRISDTSKNPNLISYKMGIILLMDFSFSLKPSDVNLDWRKLCMCPGVKKKHSVPTYSLSLKTTGPWRPTKRIPGRGLVRRPEKCSGKWLAAGSHQVRGFDCRYRHFIVRHMCRRVAQVKV